MILTLIICLAFLWIYYWRQYSKEKAFNKFLLLQDRQQQVELKRAMLQLNDCNFYLEKMTDEIDKGEDGCGEIYEIRKRKRKQILTENKKVIQAINNLNG